MRNVAKREAVLVCAKTPLVDVVTVRAKRSQGVPASVLFNVGTFGEVEISGHKSAWVRIYAHVGVRELFALRQIWSTL